MKHTKLQLENNYNIYFKGLLYLLPCSRSSKGKGMAIVASCGKNCDTNWPEARNWHFSALG